MIIDITKCTGCGSCASACPQEAITIRNNLAMINRDLCIECGRCAAACPSGAISEEAPAAREPANEGGGIYGYGRAPGFRGASPSRPNMGRGRGGTPRYQQRRLTGGVMYRPASRTAIHTPVREDKLGVLKTRAEKIKRDVAEMKRRIQALEKK